MTWATRGTLLIFSSAATGSGEKLDSARMVQTQSDSGQHSVDEILQPAGRCFPVRVELRVHDDGGPVVATAKQRGLGLQKLSPIRVHDILAVYPVPAPNKKTRGGAAQLRLAQWNFFVVNS